MQRHFALLWFFLLSAPCFADEGGFRFEDRSCYGQCEDSGASPAPSSQAGSAAGHPPLLAKPQRSPAPLDAQTFQRYFTAPLVADPEPPPNELYEYAAAIDPKEFAGYQDNAQVVGSFRTADGHYQHFLLSSALPGHYVVIVRDAASGKMLGHCLANAELYPALMPRGRI